MMNSCLQKNKSWLTTLRLGKTKTRINFILVNNKYRISVKDVKVMPGGEIVSERCLLLMSMVFKKKIRRKAKFSKKLKLEVKRVLKS